MRYSLLLLSVFIISLTSCRKDFDTVASNGKLEFSKTTVYLDTVFTNVSSSTYMLKVYNRSSDDITIPSVALAKGNASKYRIMVDGQTGIDADNSGFGDGKIFQNVEILAKDSLFVFIEATAGIVDANPSDLLYTDEILFDNGAFQQKVDLVTLIQNAVFLFPEKFSNGTTETLTLGDSEIYGFFLDDTELTFTNDKPYIIYGYAAVPPLKTLTIEAGARVHFHDQSGIIVANTGSIQVNGTPSTDPILLENEVIFEGDRLEPGFAEVPGQWGTIYLTDGSTNNIFTNCIIKNASVGILVENQVTNSTVQIRNTQIYNSANVGILARNAKINGENIVINNASQAALACTLGGTYNFKHCTFVNYWTGSSRQTPAVVLDNSLKVDNTIFKENLTVSINNSIIFGPNNVEIGINKEDGTAFIINLDYNLIKCNDNNGQLATNTLYSSLILNNPTVKVANNDNPNDPKFKDTSKNDLRISSTSSARGFGNSGYVVLRDILNNDRLSPFDLGAYNFSDD